MQDDIDLVDDDIEIREVRYDPVDRDELPTLTTLTVVLPERWGDTTTTLSAIEHHGPGYTAQAELADGGSLGLWASEWHGQPDEPTVLYEQAGLRVTWQPQGLRARITVDGTSMFALGDGIEAGHFETWLRSLRVVAN